MDFIQHLDTTNWFGLPHMAQTSCQFAPSSYADSLYRQFNIPFPESLLKSVTKRRAEFLAGRYCAGQALQQLNALTSSVPIGELRSPVWPEGIWGSISHSGQSAVAVVSDDPDVYGIGIDMEEKVKQEVIEETGSYILTQADRALFNANVMDDAELFTLIFSMKESFFKAAFPLVKRYFDFDALTVTAVDTEKQVVQCRLNYTLHEHLSQGMLFYGHYHWLHKYDTNHSLVGEMQGCTEACVATCLVIDRKTLDQAV